MEENNSDSQILTEMKSVLDFIKHEEFDHFIKLCDNLSIFEDREITILLKILRCFPHRQYFEELSQIQQRMLELPVLKQECYTAFIDGIFLPSREAVNSRLYPDILTHFIETDKEHNLSQFLELFKEEYICYEFQEEEKIKLIQYIEKILDCNPSKN
eukprot:UN30094